jgi:hypothetical protein
MAKKSGNKTRPDPKKVVKTVANIAKVAAVGYAGYQVVTNPLGVVRFLFNIYQTSTSRNSNTNASVEKYGLTNTYVPDNPRPNTVTAQPNSRAWIINDYYLMANAKRENPLVNKIDIPTTKTGSGGSMNLEFLQ